MWNKSKQRACGGATRSPRDGPWHPRLTRRPSESWPPRAPAPPFPAWSSSAPTREPSLLGHPLMSSCPRGNKDSASSKRTHPGRTNPRAVLWSLRPELWPRSPHPFAGPVLASLPTPSTSHRPTVVLPNYYSAFYCYRCSGSELQLSSVWWKWPAAAHLFPTWRSLVAGWYLKWAIVKSFQYCNQQTLRGEAGSYRASCYTAPALQWGPKPKQRPDDSSRPPVSCYEPLSP